MDILVEYSDIILKGIGNTLLAVILSSVLPFSFGALATVLASKNKIVEKAFSFVSLPFECLCPAVMIILVYFYSTLLLADKLYISPLVATVVTLSICFLGYMPSRFNEAYSVKKNIVYNGLGLIRNLVLWSFCGAQLSFGEMVSVAKQINSMEYIVTVYFIPVVFYAVVVGVIEISRRLIKYKTS